MKEKMKISFDRAQRDFQQLKSKPEFTEDDEELLIADAIDLTGWYRIEPDKQAEELINQMILFGEKKQWSMAGPKVAFEQAKKNRITQMKSG